MGGNVSGPAAAAKAKRADGRPLFDRWVGVEGAYNLIQLYQLARALAPANSFAACDHGPLGVGRGTRLEGPAGLRLDVRTGVGAGDIAASASLLSVERLYVHESVADEFTDKLGEARGRDETQLEPLLPRRHGLADLRGPARDRTGDKPERCGLCGRCKSDGRGRGGLAPRPGGLSRTGPPRRVTRRLLTATKPRARNRSPRVARWRCRSGSAGARGGNAWAQAHVCAAGDHGQGPLDYFRCA